jgi:hypothetical protein
MMRLDASANLTVNGSAHDLTFRGLFLAGTDDDGGSLIKSMILLHSNEGLQEDARSKNDHRRRLQSTTLIATLQKKDCTEYPMPSLRHKSALLGSRFAASLLALTSSAAAFTPRAFSSSSHLVTTTGTTASTPFSLTITSPSTSVFGFGRPVQRMSMATTSSEQQMLPVEASITEKLTSTFAPSHLVVMNESHMHNV